MCDISQDATERAESKGIPCFSGEITDASFNDHLASYDLVVALEVVEHLYDPIVFLRRVYELLKDGGVFVYTTGNFSETRFLKGKWGYLNIPECHVYFFTVRTMKKCLEKVGFKIFLDPYEFYTKDNIGTRFLAKLGIVNVVVRDRPTHFLERVTYCHLFKAIEHFCGRTRFPFAVK